MKGKTSDMKLIYIDSHFRVMGVHKGKLETQYATITGTVDGCFTVELYAKYKNQIKGKFESDGYTNITVENCTKEEFESGEPSENPEAPLGYIRAYCNTTFNSGEEEVYAPIGLEYDFNEFFDETIWDMRQPV